LRKFCRKDVIQSTSCQFMNISEQMKLQKCKVGLGQVAGQCECPDKRKELEGTVDIRHSAVSDRQYMSCTPPITNKRGE